jgi:hypothetical protein
LLGGHLAGGRLLIGRHLVQGGLGQLPFDGQVVLGGSQLLTEAAEAAQSLGLGGIYRVGVGLSASQGIGALNPAQDGNGPAIDADVSLNGLDANKTQGCINLAVGGDHVGLGGVDVGCDLAGVEAGLVDLLG